MRRIYVIICIVAFVFGRSALAKGFSDVVPDDSHYDAILWLQSEGIVDGYPDGTFRADRTVNRAEFAKIIANVIYTPEEIELHSRNVIRERGVLFPDMENDAWFAPFVAMMIGNDILDGYPDGSFRPARTINFAEASKIIALAFHLNIKTHTTCIRVPDGSTVDEWYCSYVNAIADQSDFPTGVYPPRISVTRGDVAQLIFSLRGCDPALGSNWGFCSPGGE